MSSRRFPRTRPAPPPLDDLDLLSDILFGPPAHRPRSRRGQARALGALCREAERTIALALSAATDPRVNDLSVVGVRPAPDATLLEIVVVPPHPVAVAEVVELQARLGRLRGALRAELAHSLQRKRTPELRFHIGAPVEAPDDPSDPDDGGDA